jgi:hypothetical protein
VLAFLQNDKAGMSEQITWSTGKPGVEDLMLELEAEVYAYSGQLQKARELSKNAVAAAERAKEKETAASYEMSAAIREALFGNPVEARRRAKAGLALSSGRDEQASAALAMSLAGDADDAKRLSLDLAKNFPEDTIVQFNYLPTIHAQLALSRKDASKAIEFLRTSSPYDLGMTGSLYSVYVRGTAHLAMGRWPEARDDFQKILDYRSVVLTVPIGALAHLGLARACAFQGDETRGRAAYQDFLNLWKDADPDIPILKQAKTEYAKLR